MSSQLNLPHATKQKTNNEETKNKKTETLRRNGPVVKVIGSHFRLYKAVSEMVQDSR